MDYLPLYENCQLCPRHCGVNRRVRNGGKGRGFCGERDVVRVAYIGPHFGEEPPITGENGSGTVFFSGCSLRCAFCQNHQISHDNLGRSIDTQSLCSSLEEMIQLQNVHNINFVTPDHFFPHVFQIVTSIRKLGYDIPIVYNLSGYQSEAQIEMAENYVDIYLPDFKYSEPFLATRLSRCKGYPSVALEAISEMVRQKGFLDSCEIGTPIATKGVLVRHLILPGEVENSMNVLTSLFVEFGPDLPLSLMSQYHPVGKNLEGPLRRFLRREEFDLVYSHARELGFCNLFVQFPETRISDPMPQNPPFLPDFRKTQPFGSAGMGTSLLATKGGNHER